VEGAVPVGAGAVAGAAEVLSGLIGAVAVVLLGAVWPCEAVLLEAGGAVLGAVSVAGAVVLALDDGCCAEAVVVSVDGVMAELELVLDGWLAVEALELEAALLQLSETILTESTFSELMS